MYAYCIDLCAGQRRSFSFVTDRTVQIVLIMSGHTTELWLMRLLLIRKKKFWVSSAFETRLIMHFILFSASFADYKIFPPYFRRFVSLRSVCLLVVVFAECTFRCRFLAGSNASKSITLRDFFPDKTYAFNIFTKSVGALNKKIPPYCKKWDFPCLFFPNLLTFRWPQ